MKFISCKMYDADPMDRKTAAELLTRQDLLNNDADPTDEGYIVTYEDGYRSWCPAATFLKHAFCIEGETKVIKSDVYRFMGELSQAKLGDKTALVKMEHSLTGFDQYATSSCVDPSNYDQKLGAEKATEKIRNTIWNNLGFMLQWAKNGLN